MKKLSTLMKTLLIAVSMTYFLGANAYDTPVGYKVGAVYLGTEVNNQVLAETFAGYALNTDLTTLSSNWVETKITGTSGYYWAKINNTVKTVAYPATDKGTLYTCKKYSATNDGGTTTVYIYSADDGATFYTGRDFQTVFNTTGYDVEYTEDGTQYQVPSYVYGKCVSVQHRDKSAPILDYVLPTAVSTGKLVFGADIYRIQNANAPVYIEFYDSDDNRVFRIYYQNGDGRKTMYYQVGDNTAVGGAGYSEYRVYRGWGIKDMVFDLDAGTVSYTVDNVHWDSSTAANRRLVSQSAISFGTGKNIKKVRFTSDAGSSKTNYDLFLDNMYLYTLVSGTATTDDVTIIGSKDYEDGYLGSTSSDYIIKPNGKLHLKFKNYGSGAYNWNNWIALFNNADKSSNLAYIRSDAWDLVSSSNTGITTSGNYWDAFEGDMYGSDVVMDITRTDGNVNMVANITTTTSKELSLTFSKAIGNAAEDIVFRLSEEAACLVFDNTKTALVAPPSFTQTGITNTGNPIITVSENGGDAPTPGSAIYYTTNGDTPTASSTSYAAPVTVTGGSTIKAITVVTASDGSTTLTSNASSLETTTYVKGQTYDLTVPTESEIASVGFGNKNASVNYGVGTTSRQSYNVESDGLTVMNGVTLQGSGSGGTYWYWMTGQGLWQAGGDRSVTLNSTLDGEIALFTLYDCRHDGSSWSLNTESDYYESDCSYTLSKSKNSGNSGDHVYIVKKVQSFVPAGTSISATIGSLGFTTFSSPYALDCSDLPDGLTAYYVVASNIDKANSRVRLTEVKEAVAAGTGLLLRGTASANYNIPVVATGTDLSATNKLVGCPTVTTLTSGTTNVNNFYVLVNGDSEVEFQNVATYVGSNNISIPAGKAYLDATGVGAARLSIVFGDEATGVQELKNSRIEGLKSCYDLQGRRVAQPTRGLYIMNGRKYVAK